MHLRTPKDTGVGKVLESCLKMLGSEDEKDTFILKITEGEGHRKDANTIIAFIQFTFLRNFVVVVLFT